MILAGNREVDLSIRHLFLVVFSSRSRGAEGAMPPPPQSPVKISYKKDGHQRRLHRFHVSQPHPTLTRPLDPLLVFIEGLSLTVADSGYSVRRGTNPYTKAMCFAGFFFLFFFKNSHKFGTMVSSGILNTSAI